MVTAFLGWIKRVAALVLGQKAQLAQLEYQVRSDELARAERFLQLLSSAESKASLSENALRFTESESPSGSHWSEVVELSAKIHAFAAYYPEMEEEIAEIGDALKSAAVAISMNNTQSITKYHSQVRRSADVARRLLQGRTRHLADW